jgi:large subunit ribosomal protein L1
MGKIRINTLGDASLEQKQKVKTEKRKTAKETKVSEGPQEPKGPGVKKTLEDKDEKKVVEVKAVEKTFVKKSDKTVAVATKAKHSKKYQTVAIIVEKNKLYPLSEALDILPKVHLAKFDETVELHINTQTSGISGNVVLPHGTGKQVRVAILAPAKDEKAAADLLKEIESGTINFDVLIATPDAMSRLAKVARFLGPRGLMPNPKNGTVTQKPDEAAKKFAGGQVNFKTESKVPVIHMSVGKLSFKKDQLLENIKTAVEAIQNKNIKNVTLKSTMSPGIKIQL